MKKTLFRMAACLLVLCFLLPYAAAEEESKTAELDAMFTTADLADATIADMLEAMGCGRLTSERLTQMYLDRIEAYDLPMELRTIINLNPNALEDAKEADRARAGGASGRLLGIPILVKDSIDVAGMPTTCGAFHRRSSIAVSDAEAVARLRAEGAIILGKTNLATFAESGSNSISEIAGMVGNAYDPARTPAGSSGGSAVAAACNFAAATLGTDTFSSLRRPASFAGIYTLRSSFGMVSQNGMYRVNYDQDVIGPMCRNVEDLALIFDIITGTDEKDPYTAEADSYLPKNGYLSALDANGLQGKRIGYLANSFGYLYQAGTDILLDKPKELDPKITGMVERAKQTLTDGGAELIDISDILSEYYVASVVGNESPINMLGIREHVTQVLRENNIDAVIYVSQTDVAETQEDPTGKFDNLSRYINTFSPLGGLPEMMLPMGLCEPDPAGGFPHALPLGLSMFSGYGNDAVLLEIAYAYEQQASVQTHPWTTPVLPDPALTDFAQELLQEATELERSLYTESSLTEIDNAAHRLSEMLLAAENGDAALDVVTYQAAVRELAAAYDGRELSSQETTETSEATEATEATKTKETAVYSEKDAVVPRNTSFPWIIPLIVAAVSWALIFAYKRKHGDE